VNTGESLRAGHQLVLIFHLALFILCLKADEPPNKSLWSLFTVSPFLQLLSVLLLLLGQNDRHMTKSGPEQEE
jgi:hypothetical protein